MTAAHTTDPVPLVLTKASAEPGQEEPPDAVIRIQMRLSRMPLEHPTRFVAEVERVQTEDAERLAEVLADTLPEGTLQRLLGFLLVRTAGARMGVAPLGDARAAGPIESRALAELHEVRRALEGAWGPGEISRGHSPRVLADQLVARVVAAETRERLAALASRDDPQATVAKLERIRRTLGEALGVEGAHDAEALAEVAAQKLGGGS
jgi:hypothetical protein